MILSKTALGKALAYSLNQWPKLIHYTEDGNLNIDNNRAERAIKPFVIGRKNLLFSNTANGAQASATLYSMIETPNANSLVPSDYLNYLLSEIPKLLPWEFAKVGGITRRSHWTYNHVRPHLELSGLAPKQH